MHITASAVSLNVQDVTASSAFLAEHFGFRQGMAAEQLMDWAARPDNQPPGAAATAGGECAS